jgi:hypothetical protein
MGATFQIISSQQAPWLKSMHLCPIPRNAHVGATCMSFPLVWTPWCIQKMLPKSQVAHQDITIRWMHPDNLVLQLRWPCVHLPLQFASRQVIFRNKLWSGGSFHPRHSFSGKSPHSDGADSVKTCFWIPTKLKRYWQIQPLQCCFMLPLGLNSPGQHGPTEQSKRVRSDPKLYSVTSPSLTATVST